MSTLSQMLKKMIDVNTPIIYIQDYDFVRVDELIKNSIGEAYKKAEEWNPGLGQIRFWTKAKTGQGKMGKVTLNEYLYDVYSLNTEFGIEYEVETKYVILRDIQDLIDDVETKTLLQLIAQRKLYDRHYETTIIIVSSILKVPKELDKYVSMLDIDNPFPTDKEIEELINEHIEENGYDPENFKDTNNLMPSLKGLTKFEIDRMLDMAMSKGGTLSSQDKEQILQHKKQMVKKSGVLDLVSSKERIEDIGGLETLKKYLDRKAKIINNLGDAIKYGVTVPKGVFLVGMPGCGKSLCAKAAAALFEVPLLKMDMGSLMGKYVGESEENLRKAIRIAEAASPCVLWIDEIEKAFNGVGGQNSEVLTRMFGYFLSWMQEKTSSVYVIATANNATNLPPELKRKGRFDEIFCVNLPNKEECKTIFEVKLKKKWREDEKNIDKSLLNVSEKVEEGGKKTLVFNFNISNELIAYTQAQGFNGADIESVVNEAIEECYLKGKEKLTSEILLKIAKNTTSISQSCGTQIKEMEDIFKKDNFIDASKGKK